MFILPVLLSLSATGQSNVQDWLDGDWEGTGYQPGSNSSWALTLSVNSYLNEASVSYPGLQCRGTWEIRDRDNEKIVFEEIITEGKNRCIDGSRIVVTLLANSLVQVAWFSDYSEGADAYAVLKRNLSFLNGRWSGIGFQTNNGHTRQADLYFDREKGIASVTYPSLKCGGEWKFKKTQGRRYYFTELIQTGEKNCLSGKTVIISRINQDFINVAWDSENIEGIDAFAVFERKSE